MDFARRRTPQRPTARSRRIRFAAWTAAAALTAAGVGGWLLYAGLDHNRTTTDVDAALGGERPPRAATGALNILLLGSDSRAGQNQRYGTDEGSARSDTAMLVHLARERTRAVVVSIPRDTMVDRPACPLPGGGTARAEGPVMVNTAFEVGGPACAVKTVEQLGQVRIDHVISVDFNGFKELVDAVGGVRITTDTPIHDRYSHLDLGAGSHLLDGEQALGLVRTRHGVGDGSDLARIRLQQAFMTALARQLTGSGLLTDPVRLYKVADTATRAITTDQGLSSVSDLLGLARSLAGLKPSDTEFRTLPVGPYPPDHNRAAVKQPEAAALWRAIRNDTPAPAREK
ncbi:transcriptional regulator [Streptomyces albospinus]|uniref:Transcriptional regulator n=1 Tax=Streptomyces albospinus TaxID=285515 RepID=A0ABQ2UPH3_9ACTN|nr:LCP family protein [Streptomyces albospinus]GGU47062.1 transcriptional regulator [Streptomyces albospinus]